MNNIDIIIKMLLEKTNLSELEKDIVESYNTYLKEDKKDIISKIVENRIKYNINFFSVPDTVPAQGRYLANVCYCWQCSIAYSYLDFKEQCWYWHTLTCFI